jgi:hypothetical protein
VEDLKDVYRAEDLMRGVSEIINDALVAYHRAVEKSAEMV